MSSISRFAIARCLVTHLVVVAAAVALQTRHVSADQQYILVKLTNGADAIDDGTAVGPTGIVYQNGQPTQIDLKPPGFFDATLNGISGGEIVGTGENLADHTSHAMLWTGPSASDFVDLGAGGAHGVYNGIQAGGTLSGAAVWHGSAASVQPLGSAGYTQAGAFGIWGDEVVGVGDNPLPQALLWNLSTGGAPIDLAPGGTSSEALGVSHGQIVGWATEVTAAGAHPHAALWTGPSASDFIDLNPAGSVYSEADASNGIEQVGFIESSLQAPSAEAVVWRGSPTGYQVLPVPPGTKSWAAFGVDAMGDIVGGYDGIPAVWIAVPEPDGIVALAFIVLLRRQRRGRWPRYGMLRRVNGFAPSNYICAQSTAWQYSTSRTSGLRVTTTCKPGRAPTTPRPF